MNQLGGIDPNATVGSVVVVSATGQPQRAYLVKPSDKQVAILDTHTPAPIWSQYTCHSWTGQAQDREQVKRIVRVKLYGTGTILPDAPAVPADRLKPVPSGILTLTADNTRQEVYLYSALAAEPWNGILWAQGCLGLSGRVFDLDFKIYGMGVTPREYSLEYVVSN